MDARSTCFVYPERVLVIGVYPVHTAVLPPKSKSIWWNMPLGNVLQLRCSNKIIYDFGASDALLKSKKTWVTHITPFP